MTDVRFKMGQIRHDSKISETFDTFEAELESMGIPNTWPKNDLYHYAAVFFDDEPVTVLFNAPIDIHKKIYSVGAYTDPKWRRRGLYTFVWLLCVNEWRREGVWEFFQSGYHKENHISAAMQKAQGRYIFEEREHYMRTRFCLKPTGKEFEITEEHLQPIVDFLEKKSVSG